MFNLIHNRYVIKVDLVVRKESPYRRREFSRMRKVSIDDQEIYVVAPEDLILSKVEWAKESRSEVQLTDVRNLLRSVKRLNAVTSPAGRSSWVSSRSIARSQGERHLRQGREKVFVRGY
jgi:hypothetical protein